MENNLWNTRREDKTQNFKLKVQAQYWLKYSPGLR